MKILIMYDAEMPNICWFKPLRCKDIFGLAGVKKTNKQFEDS